MIPANSRYSQSGIALAANVDGVLVQTIVPSQQQDYVIQFTYYMITGRDTIDRMAYQFYGDVLLWWKIADSNPEIMMWDDLPVGTFIRIPSS